MSEVLYTVDGPIARIVLNRPARGNALTLPMIASLADLTEQANLDPAVHVIALSGNGSGFCAGYDLVAYATEPREEEVWDPVADYQVMSRNVRAFMSMLHSDKPVITKLHGFCVAGGTDLALCADLLVVSDDLKIGYPPARVWGVPTSALWAARLGVGRAKRLLLTGDCIDGRQALDWGLAAESAPSNELDEVFEALVQRVARLPINQLVMHKLLVNQQLFASGLHLTQTLSTFFDGIARHTPEGYAFQRLAAASGWKEAVRQRDEPFGDFGRR